MEIAIQINERLKGFGNLASDGRPILNMTAPQLVEQVMAVSSENMIFPAHAWTPWFSIFGAFSGFDTCRRLLPRYDQTYSRFGNRALI